MYPRNVYYENQHIKNRIKNGEDVVELAKSSPIVQSLLSLDDGSIKTIYHLGFGLGHYFKAIKDLMPEVKLYGCEFDPMFLNFGQNLFQINDLVESVNIYGSMEDWHVNMQCDVVVVEDWFFSLDRDLKKKVFDNAVKISNKYIIFEKMDEDFDFDEKDYVLHYHDNGVTVVEKKYRIYRAYTNATSGGGYLEREWTPSDYIITGIKEDETIEVTPDVTEEQNDNGK